MELSNEVINIFKPKRKCIINADLDGLLSGMILQEFLEWEVVGFSSCCGKPDDELWLYNIEEDINDCVFVDLPVYIKEYSTIDQHFVAFDKDSIEKYNNDGNKANPNIIRDRVFSDEQGKNQYTMKYPFGTIHFIIAVLEKMGIISDNYTFNFEKKLGEFDLADLILRADRVIGNTASYTPNCIDWLSWLVELGGINTKRLFEKVKNELMIRKISETKVEQKMKELGCKGIDGDCSNLFRNKEYEQLSNFFQYLSDAINMNPIPLKEIYDFGKLTGKRYEVTNKNFDFLKEESMKKNMFSFAFVTMRSLSVTYIEGDDFNE